LSQGKVKYATRQRRVPEAWLAAVEAGGHGFEEFGAIDRDAQIVELVMMGLRLSEGIARARLEALAGIPIEALFARSLPALVEGGFVRISETHIAATAAGRQRLDAVLAELLT
jgi:oxygen-independent coproporphyrinogen-3 oxidase